MTRRPPLLEHPMLVDLDNKLYAEMLNTVGEELAMPACDAVWRVLTDWPMPPSAPTTPPDDEGSDDPDTQ